MMKNTAVAALSLLAAQPVAANAAPTPNPISAARLNALDKEISSDAFEGRAPGTSGEEKTVA